MPPSDSPNTGGLAGAQGGGAQRDSGASSQSTLPARDINIPARDLDPDHSSSRAWDGGGLSRGMSGGMAGAGVGGRISEQASDIKEQAREKVRQTYDQVRGFTNEALDKARQQWSESRGRVGERAQEMVRTRKDRLCEGIDGVIEATRCAADTLEERQGPVVAGYARSAVGGLEQVRDYLRAADVNDLADDVRQFTRRHPEWVLGGMFVAGLALSRFLKADRHHNPRGRPPHGADEGLYQDVYRSQFEGTGYRGRGYAGDDFDDFGAYRPSDDFDRGFGDAGASGMGATGTYGTSTGSTGPFAAGGTSTGATSGVSDLGGSGDDDAGLESPGTHDTASTFTSDLAEDDRGTTRGGGSRRNQGIEGGAI